MPNSIDDALTKVIDDVSKDLGDLDKTATAVKTLKTFAEAKKLLDPEPEPEKEPTGIKAFFDRHAGDLIKVGGSFIIVVTIAIIETKGDVIFRSKASKFI